MERKEKDETEKRGKMKMDGFTANGDVDRAETFISIVDVALM